MGGEPHGSVLIYGSLDLTRGKDGSRRGRCGALLDKVTGALEAEKTPPDKLAPEAPEAVKNRFA